MKTRTGVRATDQGWGAGLGVELSPDAGRHTRASLRPAGFGWRDFFEVAKRSLPWLACGLLAYGIALCGGCL